MFNPLIYGLMKIDFRYTLVAACLAFGFGSCDDNLEAFTTGSASTPAAFAESAIHYEALPGQIKLTWDAPTDAAYDYVKIKYYDFLQQKDVCLIASRYTSELVIDDTRARFGDYTFTFQTFNSQDEGGAVTTVKARSGAAPVSLSYSKVTIAADQLSTDNQEPSEGPVKNLVNGSYDDFFHTRWSSPQKDLPQYFQIDFKETHTDFMIKYYNRKSNNKDGRVTEAQLQISDDGTNWETAQTLSGLPTASGASYTSDIIYPGKSFKYLRFLVTATSSGKYFHMAEFEFYDVNVYDPETAPLE